MPRYRVQVEVEQNTTLQYALEVEAENEDAACPRALQIWNERNGDEVPTVEKADFSFDTLPATRITPLGVNSALKGQAS